VNTSSEPSLFNSNDNYMSPHREHMKITQGLERTEAVIRAKGQLTKLQNKAHFVIANTIVQCYNDETIGPPCFPAFSLVF